MNRGFAFSRSLATACSAAVAAACAALCIHARIGSLILDRQRGAAQWEASLTAQIASRSEFEGDRLESLRGRVRRARLQLGSEDTWDRVVRRFGERWSVEAGPRDDRDGCSIQSGTFRLKSPALADWPGIVDAIGDSEALPGVGVEDLDMKTSGGLERRSLDSVTIRVSVQTRRTDASLARSR
jgi:hypothetical protein